MDRRVIEEKLESLRRCVRRIEAKRPATVEMLKADADIQDIITLNLTRAVQLCVDIASHLLAETEVPPPSSMSEAFDALAELRILKPETAINLKKAVGFRNIAVHNYQVIDWQIVFEISGRYLDDFRVFAREVSEELENNPRT
jgi:uncharacterized protein YutE (UPF0331/DUF86 family)